MWQPRERPPAFVALNAPALPTFEPARPAEAVLVERVLGPGLKIERMVLENFRGDSFRVSGKSDQQMLFRRHAVEDGARETEEHEIALFLYRRGIATPEPLSAPAPLPAPEEGLFSLRRFVAHRPVLANRQDLVALASSLAAFHAVAAAHPAAGEWLECTDRRLSSLNGIRNRIATGSVAAGPDPERLAVLARRTELDFGCGAQPRRVLHGDLNRANVFMGKADGEPYFVDFEDMPHSVLPLLFELALVLERHVLVPEPDDARAGELGRAFLAAYGEAAGASPAPMPAGGELRQAALSLNLRSLCVLALLAEKGVPIPEGEWEKFFFLFAEAERRAAAWTSMA